MKRESSVTQDLGTLGALLRAPFDALQEFVYRDLGKAGHHDVRPAHGAVLRNISREGSRVTEMAERARITKQSMAELIEYLRARGYVELAPDPSDGRAKLVRLTAQGWKLHGALVRRSREFENECARGIGGEKWRQFRALLQSVAHWSVTQSTDG
jgi:DNA-binding MarR family transcriptional regulator